LNGENWLIDSRAFQIFFTFSFFKASEV